MKKKRTLCLLNGNLFSGNMGCNALTYGAIEILHAVSDLVETEFEIIVEDFQFVDGMQEGLLDLVAPDVRIVPRFQFGRREMLRSLINPQSKRRHAIQKEVLRSIDLFLCAVEGDSFSDIYGQERLKNLHSLTRFVKSQKKDYVLLPQTIGPFEVSGSDVMAKEIIQQASGVYTRDPLSTQCVKELLPAQDVMESVDMALFMGYERATNSSEVVRVGVNPSALLWNGGYSRSNQFGLKDDYQHTIRAVISRLCQTDGVQVELVAHVIPGFNFIIEDDYLVCKILQREFPDCVVAPHFYSPVEAKTYISGLDMLIGSRMHCCIAAFSSGVPVYPLAYSRKFKGLFEGGFGYKEYSDLKVEDHDTVITKLMDAFRRREEVRELVKKHNAVLPEKKRLLVESLAQTIEKMDA